MSFSPTGLLAGKIFLTSRQMIAMLEVISGKDSMETWTRQLINCSSFVMQSFIQISGQKMCDVIFELKTIKSNRYLVLLHLKPDMASRSCSRPESSRVRDGNIFLLLGNNGPTAFQRCVDRDDAKGFLKK